MISKATFRYLNHDLDKYLTLEALKFGSGASGGAGGGVGGGTGDDRSRPDHSQTARGSRSSFEAQPSAIFGHILLGRPQRSVT